MEKDSGHLTMQRKFIGAVWKRQGVRRDDAVLHQKKKNSASQGVWELSSGIFSPCRANIPAGQRHFDAGPSADTQVATRFQAHHALSNPQLDPHQWISALIAPHARGNVSREGHRDLNRD